MKISDSGTNYAKQNEYQNRQITFNFEYRKLYWLRICVKLKICKFFLKYCIIMIFEIDTYKEEKKERKRKSKWIKSSRNSENDMKFKVKTLLVNR